MHRRVEPRRERMGIDWLVQSRQTNYIWQRAVEECTLKREACYRADASLFTTHFLSSVLLFSLFFFLPLPPMLITFTHRKSVCVQGCKRNWAERWRGGKKKPQRTQRKRGRKKNLLIHRGRAECDLPALRIWWMAEKLASRHLTFFCYLTSAGFLLPFSHYCSLLNKDGFLSSCSLVPECCIQWRKLCTARTLG